MTDLLLQYRACGAECREDWLRMLAHDNGLPIGAVRRLADALGEREDFGELVRVCEEGMRNRITGGRSCELAWIAAEEVGQDRRAQGSNQSWKKVMGHQ